jgi:four helix bundle protein
LVIIRTCRGWESAVWDWQKAHRLVIKIYKLSKTYPKNEIFGLTSQLRRAAISVPANIAEGFKRVTLADKLRFYNIAQGSLEEVRYYLILSQDLGYAQTIELMKDLEEVSRLLESFMKSLKRKK